MKFNFISIPRNGSQTIHAALGTNKYLNHYSWKKYEDDGIFSFAFIREPIERLYSWYHFHKTKYYKNPLVNTEIYYGDFNSWANRGFKTHWSGQACDDLGVQTPLSQYGFIEPRDDQKGLELFSFNKINETLPGLAKRFGIKANMGHAGKSHKPIDFKSLVSEKTIKLAEELFPEDFLIYEVVNSDLPSS